MKLRMLQLMQEAGAESTGAGGTGTASSEVAVTNLAGIEQSVDGETSSTDVEGDSPSTDWEDLMQDKDEEEAPSTTPVSEQKPVAEKPVVEQKPAVATETKPVAEQKPAVEQTVGETKPAMEAKPAAVEQKTPEQQEAARVEFEKAEKDRFDGLVKSYELPEDMAVKLQTEPENVLPYLAARVHQNLARQLSQAMEQLMPQFVHSYNEGNKAETAARSAFETRWPELKGMDKEVLEVGALFRRLNPKASAEEAIERIGSIVVQAKGMAVAGKPVGIPATAAAPKPAVFTPAGGGSTSRASAPAPETNEFSRMADEFLTEDS